MDTNPYASPAYIDEPVLVAKTNETIRRSTYRQAFVRWLLICYGCAIPSFLWGVMVGSKQVHVEAMLSGIFCFVVAYAIAEANEAVYQFRLLPHVNATLKVGFGLRLLISLLFPVGMFFDLWLGMVSVSTCERLLGRGPDPVNVNSGPPEDFAAFFVTTIIQGLLINAVLVAFMLVVYGAKRMFSRPQPMPITSGSYE